MFATVSTASQIPLAIHKLRRRAEHDVAGPRLLGRHIAFFWDDPTRLVDVHTGAGPIMHGAADTVDALIYAGADQQGGTLGGPAGQDAGIGAHGSHGPHDISTGGSVNGSGSVHSDHAADPGEEPRADTEEARP
ncbi:hypothetical protein ACFQ0G_09340 [Streptomyces chiangmaiensis]